jgi:hypothetical protein
MEKGAAADEVSVEQVRQHLQQMGFAAVPDALVLELRGELLARMSSAAPTPMHPGAKVSEASAPLGMCCPRAALRRGQGWQV